MTPHPEEDLAHYGVMGMKWGKQKSRDSGDGTPRRTRREAGRDAKESARAKMYYGEGAGIRRRQIKAKVESKMKDPAYKKAYEASLASQDMGKAGSKARSERKRNNVKNHTVKTAKGIRHLKNGNTQWANASAAALVAGGVIAKQRGYDKVALKKGTELASKAVQSDAAQQVKRALQNWKS